MSSSGATGQIPALDGLRGLAVLAVIWFHTQFGLGTNSEPTLLDVAFQRVKGVGWVGVDLFFVLSGFLITRILLESKEKEDGFRTFWRKFLVRRSLRIFPLGYLYVVGLVVLAAFLRHRGVGDQWQTIYENKWWFLTYNTNFLMALGGGAVYAVHLWSLAIEEQFYLLWPFVVYFLSKERLRVAGILAVLLALAARLAMYAYDPTWVMGQYVLPFARMDSLVLGALIALHVRYGGFEQLRRWSVPVFWMGMALLFAMWLAFHGLFLDHPMVRTVGYSVTALVFGAVLVQTLNAGSAMERICRVRFLRFFGTYSYGMYVWHVPILESLARYLPGEAIMTGTGTRIHYQVGYFICVVLLVTAVSVASYEFYERRFLALKDRLAPSA